MMNRFALAVLAVLSLAGCNKRESVDTRGTGTTTVAAGDFAGHYDAVGTNPGGSGGYKGTTTIARKGGYYTVDWNLPGSPPYTGVGITSGNNLGVGWGLGGQFGVVVYEINGGKLTGKWAVSGQDGIGTETIEGSPGLSGTYKITAATKPGGKGTYAGTVTITQTGDTYNVQWKLAAGDSYGGAGIKSTDGKLLVVGWSIGSKGSGVLNYTKSGTKLMGMWSAPGGAQQGTETLSPK